MQSLIYAFFVSLHLQLSILIGMSLSTVIGIFYIVVKDPRYPNENIVPTLVGAIIALLCFFIGHYLHRKHTFETKVDMKIAVLIVVNAWIIACLISSVTFILAGFPNLEGGNFSAFRIFTDSFFESMSGLTTTGSSILYNVETIPQSVNMWRSFSHWIGGMGLVYMTITVINNFKYSRFNLINAEVESPEASEFKDEYEARNSGFDFLKIYSLLTVIMMVMLIISGFSFRRTPYVAWYDNVYDSVFHTFSVLGTGGFSNYNLSAGLPVQDAEGNALKAENGDYLSGGLQNPVSEWIIAFFMFFSGANFGLWFLLFYKRDFKAVRDNVEFRLYTIGVVLMSIIIGVLLVQRGYSANIEEGLRYAFFSISSVISTTGLANTDFTHWPPVDTLLLSFFYFIGGTIGSTAGGLKVKRIYAFVIDVKNEIRNFIRNKKDFVPVRVDTSNFNRRDMSLITINIAFYFILFVLASIFIMLFTDSSVDLTTSFTAALASLGNIGPAAFITTVNHGPSGNYAAFSEIAKWIMIGLMLFGRIGVLKLFFLIANFRKFTLFK